MKKISITKTKKELENSNVDAIHTDMIINNIQLYNDLLDEYKTSKHNAYLIYQLNMQIVKQLVEVKKLNEKLKPDKPDEFTNFINNIKSNKMN